MYQIGLCYTDKNFFVDFIRNLSAEQKSENPEPCKNRQRLQNTRIQNFWNQGSDEALGFLEVLIFEKNENLEKIIEQVRGSWT